jgi:hypothetical protein
VIRYDGRIVIGVVLIAIGLSLLATDVLALGDGVVIVSIGAVLLAAYALTRRYGFLVPGMILVGAGIGTGVQDAGYDESGGFVAVYAGAGFLGIWVLDLFARGPSRWWPLVPGSILLLFGVATVTKGTPAGALVEQLWPLALVAAGIVIVASAALRDRATAPRPAAPSATARGGV